ncbi:protoporphyrinogen oxidase [Balneicella halophila]|uniref:Protoporphyrinogen oxidase n=1 Tax=Balneicella halophila TaxID=1537566 RepID=A0A7L4URV0_BALHA|nr:FAD-dependent oxidoreductase [Balneicella halophila]PVX52483.1 protoporphyrinogen oxidase [Balneicella halophila]
MEISKYDITIIGGGISGLSLAYMLANMDRKVLVLDKTKRVGGAVESFTHDDYTIDLGAHTAYNSYVTFIELLEQTSVKNQLKEREKQKYFFSTSNGIQKLTKPLNFGELFFNLPKILGSKKEGKSVREYYAPILGKKNYNNFARHFFKAVLCQSADNYPVAFFLKRRNTRNKAYPRSFTFSKGLQTFTDGLQQHPNITVITNSKAEKITKNKKEFDIQTANSTFSCPNIAFACHADAVVNLTKELAPTLSSILDQISYQGVSSLGIIVDKKQIQSLRTFAGLLTPTEKYTSIVSRDIVSNENYRGFSIHSQGNLTANDLRTLLCEELNITPNSILQEKYKNNYLPQLRKGHEELLEAMTEEIASLENIYVTGNYFQGLSLEDCLLRSKEEALRYISKA